MIMSTESNKLSRILSFIRSLLNHFMRQKDGEQKVVLVSRLHFWFDHILAKQRFSSKHYKPFTPQMGRIRMALKGQVNNFYTIPSQNEINKMLASISSKVNVNKFNPNTKSRLFDYEQVRKDEIQQVIHHKVKNLTREDTTPMGRRTMSAPQIHQFESPFPKYL